MKLSLNWLQEFIELTEKNADTLKRVVTANIAEVETMESLGAHLEGVVVGQIVKIMAHPNADALKLTMVDNGTEHLKVVCGGSNLREGMKVALAQIGAVVRWHGTEVVKMEKAKIRGEESFGMICASNEIGIDELYPARQEKEIVDLSALEAAPGTPLAKALGLHDTLIDIDNHALTNRADLFSHYGFAREFVANGLAEWKKAKAFKMPAIKTPAPIEVKVKDKALCERYMGVYVTGVTVAESPDWMKCRLAALGVRPISNMVDITNYVMLELGMPMHAFDTDQVKGKTWTMRQAKKGEKVITLDQKEYELPEGAIVFDDGHELFDLCGIMGGYQSGIKAETTKIWLHAPVYNPVLIRRASRGLGHVTDASVIYEKGVDPELAAVGLARAVELILQVCPEARVASEVMDIRHTLAEERVINLSFAAVERLIGLTLTPAQIEKILKALGFTLKKAKGGYVVTVPSWRMNDTTMEADLIEDIARVHGYDEIPFTTPVVSAEPPAINHRRLLERDLRNKLAALGFDEIYTFAFLGPDLLKKCGMNQDHDTIEVMNPISADMSLMRRSLLPRTLETIADNLRYHDTFRLFELSRTYGKDTGHKDTVAHEASHLIAATVGEDFRALQGVMEQLGFSVKPHDDKALKLQEHPGRAAAIARHGRTVGRLYELHPLVAKNFDIKKPVVVAELDVELLHAMPPERTKSKDLPKFPSVKLDVSLLIPGTELAQKYLNLIEKAGQTLIDRVDIVDEYSGDKIAAGKRSLTYSITYRAAERTLTDDEVQAVHQKVIKQLEGAGASIR